MNQRTGVATFGLDYGTCPPWLFAKMKRLARLLAEAIVWEFSPTEFIKRMSNPFFFQSFGTILAFDWDASGLTTTTTAAIKEALRGTERSLGVFVAGGKGRTSLKTPEDIRNHFSKYQLSINNCDKLIYASKMSAKVDNTAVQDGFQLYHHAFFFDRKGNWSVVQQGMNEKIKRARRYHWFSKGFSDFVEEPHAGITQPQRGKVLNLVSKKSRDNKDVSVELVKDIKTLRGDLKVLDYVGVPFDKRRLESTLNNAYERSPENFENLLAVRGVGPKTIRALSLISELIYGAAPSYQDPARYSFAHGGKDGIPYPVDRKVYDQSISVLERAVRRAKLQHAEKEKVFRKLETFL
ncbi:DUF763 domain-containing protein [Candidatus Saccharibacteria bacterium]|nr:DUF763 domain-containing protein [Candidatus Saccharibacteria bacterium]